MPGFITDCVNLIATNLRDLTLSSFPILKELIQNADDGGAENLFVGYHKGFGDSSKHQLLKGLFVPIELCTTIPGEKCTTNRVVNVV